MVMVERKKLHFKKLACQNLCLQSPKMKFKFYEGGGGNILNRVFFIHAV